MVKNVGESTKTKVNQVFHDMKMNVGEPTNFAHSMEMGEELSGDLQEKINSRNMRPPPGKKGNNNPQEQ